MMTIAEPKWFAQRRDELRRSLRSCLDDGCILVRRAGLGHAVAVELASRLGLLACRKRLAVETGIAVCNRRPAVAVGLGSRTRLRCIEGCSIVIAVLV